MDDSKCVKLLELYKEKNKKYLAFAYAQINDCKGEEALKEFSHQWKKITIHINWMKRIFAYLDRYYLPNRSIDSLANTGLKLFKEHIFDKLKGLVVEEIFNMILREREGEIIDPNIIKHALISFKVVAFKNPEIEWGDAAAGQVWKEQVQAQIEETGMPMEKMRTEVDSNQWYIDSFEKPLVDRTRLYYQQKANGWFSKLSVIEYLVELENVINREEGHSISFLEASTNQKVLEALNDELIKNFATKLIEKETGMEFMLKHDKPEDLKKMYTLFKRVPSCIDIMANHFQPYVLERGKQITGNEVNIKDPVLFSTKILELKKELDKLIEFSFSKDTKFQKVQNIAFQTFMNDFTQTPSYLATYIDNELTKGMKGLDDASAEAKISLFISVFTSLHSRDIFLKAYQQKLKTRLLHGTLLSRSFEDNILSKLKTECGINIVGNIFKMLLDMDESNTHMDNFKKFNKDTAIVDGIELNMKVLTFGMWPEIPQITWTIPHQMDKAIKQFEKYFVSKKTNTILKPLIEDSCELSTLYLPKVYSIVCTSLQVAVLWAFNTSDKYSYTELRNKIGINDAKDEAEFKANLLSLCNPACRIIAKANAKEPSFGLDESLEINATFAFKNIRINVIPIKKKSEVGPVGPDPSIQAHRDMLMDCCIVRTMKALRTIAYNDLIAQIQPQIRLFPVEIPHIKKRIEALISKEYMKRKGKDQFEYISA